MIWELSGDTEDAELLNTAWRSLRHPLSAEVFVQTMSTVPPALNNTPPETAPPGAASAVPAVMSQ